MIMHQSNSQNVLNLGLDSTFPKYKYIWQHCYCYALSQRARWRWIRVTAGVDLSRFESIFRGFVGKILTELSGSERENSQCGALGVRLQAPCLRRLQGVIYGSSSRALKSVLWSGSWLNVSMFYFSVIVIIVSYG